MSVPAKKKHINGVCRLTCWPSPTVATTTTYKFMLVRGLMMMLTEKLVVSSMPLMRLARPCFGRGHHLYFDNYYTSPQVLGDLLLNHVSACGTLRVSHKGVPMLIRHAKLRPSHALVSKRRHGIQYLCWRDKRQVNLASTILMRTHFSGGSAIKTLHTSGLSRSLSPSNCTLALWVGSNKLITCCGHSYRVTRP